MSDLKSPSLIYLKGWLFLAILAASASLLVLESPRWRTVILTALLAWSSARFYYFMFYVIEKYVDPSYRFAGIGSFLAYCFRGQRRSTDEAN